jgi:hypothetical protein
MMKKRKALPGPKLVPASALRIEAAEGSLLKIRQGAKLWDACHIALCRPLIAPEGMGLVFDKDGKELAVVEGLESLDAASKKALQRSLRLRSLNAKVTAVTALAHQYGAVHCRVETDRGPREFVIKGLTENVRWLSDTRIIITDVDGNRFEIPDMAALDEASRELLDLVV